MLGLAFSFDGARAFVNYTDLDGHTNVDQYFVRANGSFDESSRTRIYFLEQPYPNHNGGEIVWADGSLWVFTGDGGAGGDPERFALNPTHPLGKVVRMSEQDGVWNAGEVVAAGLRNPWRVFLDQSTDEFWITDVGQSEIEEVNVVARSEIDGVSFGWSHLEGNAIFNADQATADARYSPCGPCSNTDTPTAVVPSRVARCIEERASVRREPGSCTPTGAPERSSPRASTTSARRAAPRSSARSRVRSACSPTPPENCGCCRRMVQWFRSFPPDESTTRARQRR